MAYIGLLNDLKLKVKDLLGLNNQEEQNFGLKPTPTPRYEITNLNGGALKENGPYGSSELPFDTNPKAKEIAIKEGLIKPNTILPDIKQPIITKTELPPIEQPVVVPTITPKIEEYYGKKLGDKITNELGILYDAAKKYDMPLGQLIGQYWQESSFGSNPNINEENWAKALGPLQITNKFTDENKLAYPAFKDLKISSEDRKDLSKSADFAAKHYRRLTDHYGNPDAAITAYYGDKSYLDLINNHASSPQIQELVNYITKIKEQ